MRVWFAEDVSHRLAAVTTASEAARQALEAACPILDARARAYLAGYAAGQRAALAAMRRLLDWRNQLAGGAGKKSGPADRATRPT